MKIEVEARVGRRAGFALDVRLASECGALAIVGVSGSGKTTLLDCIAGIEAGARVVLDGDDWTDRPLHQRAIGHVAQDGLLFPHLSVRRNLLYSPRASELGDVPEALSIDHLLERMPRNLSGGERRRVALARAIVSGPKLLLLDEPFAGLDEARRRAAMALLAHVMKRYGIPTILVSHMADEVIGLTDETIRLELGRIVEQGPSAAVLRASETRIDNYLDGEALGDGRVRVGEVVLATAAPAALRGPVRLGCYAHDVVLASTPPAGISARNVIPCIVRGVVGSGEGVLVELDAPPLRALVTPQAVNALAIAPGRATHAIIKATSIVALGSQP